jgi:circadian clock protein KaiB
MTSASRIAVSILRRPSAPVPHADRRPIYSFRLFVAGTEPNSTTARHNLTRLCEQYLPGRHRIDIVDVFESAAVALKHRVLVTPTLIVLKPKLGVTLLGNLSETKQVLTTLRLNGNER